MCPVPGLDGIHRSVDTRVERPAERRSRSDRGEIMAGMTRAWDELVSQEKFLQIRSSRSRG